MIDYGGCVKTLARALKESTSKHSYAGASKHSHVQTRAVSRHLLQADGCTICNRSVHTNGVMLVMHLGKRHRFADCKNSLQRTQPF